MSDNKYLFFATRKGLIKKTELTEYQSIRQSGLVAIKLDQNDELLETKTTSGNDKVLLCSSNGKAIMFSEKNVRPTGRASRGVTGMRFKAGDFLVGMAIISAQAKSAKPLQVLIVSENGFGKRTPLSEYREQGRGGSGIFTSKITPKTGKLVDMRALPAEAKADLLLISSKGQVIRLELNTVSVLGRQTQGVKLINLDPGDKVASVAVIFEEPDVQI
ncbi:MAG: gyrase subunit A protein [candidate division CPR1 bacterium GW2011_GWA2_42_17]|uniref:Gyrase subunit A protein n=1 Tax=candidate division CPR1 bacterium GW2011_GWA2_42_17 TaxID=1618341 RepID=A0A0G0YY08_9BACT|nr:MAG: gyrase subunit A protein [candidate division CPR1 bacterium GW2011_GWA2_42_17]